MGGGKRQIITDMIYSLHRFGCMFNEYFSYEFYKLNAYGRNQFFTQKIQYSYFFYFNEEKNEELFWNKEKTYELFKPYFKRDCVCITGIKDNNAFISYLKKHNIEVVIKPLYLSMGRGVKLMKSDELLNAGIEKIMDNSLYKDGFFLEEPIKQVYEMAKLHPSSLNTIRICTYKQKGKINVVGAILRMGKNGSFVDNFSAGGILGIIDVTTGIVTQIGSKYDRTSNIFHPDTNEQLLGFHIPCWEDLIKLTDELSDVVPTNKYCGWDIALTDDGWVLVEANSTGGFANQHITKRGAKDLFNQLCEL